VDPENILDRHAGRLLNGGIRVIEWQIEQSCKAPPDRGFTRAHHAYEHDAPSTQCRTHLWRDGLSHCAPAFRCHSRPPPSGATYAFSTSLTTAAKNGSPEEMKPRRRVPCRLSSAS